MSTTIDGTSLWETMGLGTESTTWYSGLAIIFQSVVLASILSKSIQYFDRYDKIRDGLKVMIGVGAGTLTSLGILILTCSQTRILVYKRKVDPPSSIRYLILSDMALLFFSGLFMTITGGYYAWRCYLMTRKNRFVLGSLSIGLLAQFIITIITASYGFSIRKLDPEFMKDLPEFMKKGNHLHEIWGGITLTISLCLSILSAFLMFKMKDGIYHHDSRIYHKYFSMTYETMLPPTICILVLVSSSHLPGSPFTDMRRVFTTILPLLYYNSYIQTLTGRQLIRSSLGGKWNSDTANAHLVDDTKHNDNFDQGTGVGGGFVYNHVQGGPRVYVSPPRRF